MWGAERFVYPSRAMNELDVAQTVKRAADGRRSIPGRDETGSAMEDPQLRHHGPRDEHERLLRFLTWPEPGFALGVVRCDGSETSQELQASVIADAVRRGRRIGVVDLAEAEPDVHVIDAMVAALDEEVDALFVTGMGQLAVDLRGEPRITAAMARLNLARDSLPRRIPHQVVLWLSSREIVGFADAAPDTWDIVRSVFLLPGTRA